MPDKPLNPTPDPTGNPRQPTNPPPVNALVPPQPKGDDGPLPEQDEETE